MAEILQGKCTQETCKYLESGICEKGHANVIECEEFTQDDNQAVNSSEKPSSTIDSQEEKEFYYFPGGQSLSEEDGNKVSTESSTQVVIIAGASGSGKTTLLASIFDKFSCQEMNGFLFAGSKTLPGFEERCHLARIASNRETPETERTKTTNEMELLHLAISNMDKPEEHTNILISDLSGERFRLIKDSTSECKKMTLLSRADHFALLIDGKELSNVKDRQNAYTDCRSLLRSCVDAKMLGRHTFVEIIFSKWDQIEPDKKENENSAFITLVKNKITDEFGHSFGKLQFYEVASRPEKNQMYPFGFNLEKVFAGWVNETPQKESLFKDNAQFRDFNGIEGYIAN